MKKLFAILTLILAAGVSPSFAENIIDFKDFQVKRIEKEAYPKYNNDCEWETVVSNGYVLNLYYKTKNVQNQKLIAELYYILESGSEKRLLGSFSIKNGFLDAKGKKLGHQRSKNLRGLSFENTLKNPFFIHAIYADKDTGKLYKTEVFIMLSFSENGKTLVNWSPW